MTDLASLRTKYRAQKAQLLQSMGVQGASGRSVRKSLHQLSALADDVLIALWTHAGLQAPYALLAVGGFGRGELVPHSDIDVLVLLPDGHSQAHLARPGVRQCICRPESEALQQGGGSPGLGRLICSLRMQ